MNRIFSIGSLLGAQWCLGSGVGHAPCQIYTFWKLATIDRSLLNRQAADKVNQVSCFRDRALQRELL